MALKYFVEKLPFLNRNKFSTFEFNCCDVWQVRVHYSMFGQWNCAIIIHMFEFCSNKLEMVDHWPTPSLQYFGFFVFGPTASSAACWMPTIADKYKIDPPYCVEVWEGKGVISKREWWWWVAVAWVRESGHVGSMVSIRHCKKVGIPSPLPSQPFPSPFPFFI